ncbi:hypothetical protein GQ53DRAFT_886754 [Thozetella sp. PMI_491]|nr:hypothetical protein GQ53DRAFT_886754 [Thozetella sp. PMI_491]
MATKTYLLAPSFDYPPGSSIRLGGLVADPLSPHRPLTSLARDKWPKTTETVQKERVITRGKGFEAGLSTTAQIIQIINAKVGGNFARDEVLEYSMAALRTEFFEADPNEDDIRDLLKHHRVQTAMDFIFWSRPLFMITGIKIAEGLSLYASYTAQQDASVSGEMPIPAAPGISVGLNTQVSTKRLQEDSFTATGDVVLAYRLLKICRKGWQKRRTVASEYRPRSAFLGDLTVEDEWSDEIEVGSAAVADISEAGVEEDLSLREVLVERDGNETVIYV